MQSSIQEGIKMASVFIRESRIVPPNPDKIKHKNVLFFSKKKTEQV